MNAWLAEPRRGGGTCRKHAADTHSPPYVPAMTRYAGRCGLPNGRLARWHHGSPAVSPKSRLTREVLCAASLALYAKRWRSSATASLAPRCPRQSSSENSI